jgi:hypothetical protein
MHRHAFAFSAFVALSLAALPGTAASADASTKSAVSTLANADLSARCSCRRHVVRRYHHHYVAYESETTVWYPRPTRDPYAPRYDPGYYFWPGGPVPPPWRHYY